MKLVRASVLGSCSRLLTLILLTAGLFGCDYASKSAAKATLEGMQAMPVAPAALGGAVELRYVENRDIAFNTFENLGLPHSPTLLAALAAVAIVAIVASLLVARRRAAAPVDWMTQAGIVLVVGGALGNLVDRVARGYVVDFIHVKGWPVFNVADIAVVLGVGAVLLANSKRKANEAPPPIAGAG
jgi:signal peptidase II